MFCLGAVTIQEADDLRALLSLDRAQLGALADLGTDVTQAIEVWYSFPYDEIHRLTREVGFAAWLHDPNRPREPLPDEEEPAAAPAVEPIYEPAPAVLDPLIRRACFAFGKLTYVLDELDPARRERVVLVME